MKKGILIIFILLVSGKFAWSQFDSRILCEFAPDPLVIEEDETWVDNKRLSNSVIIEEGATLTIKSRVAFPEDANIVVLRGARLVVDGGTLTNSCQGMWQGVQVYGTNNQPQLPTYQGIVLLKNGGTIEHAECGIRAYKTDPDGHGGYRIDMAYTGGIVVANDAYFIDNGTCVEFLRYDRESSSGFKDCRFITNGILPDNVEPDYFVKMTEVTGIFFIRCTFENASEYDFYGKGIYSLSSTYLVNYGCTSLTVPCPSYENSKFIKLKRGIYATDYSTNKYVDVRHTDFINTQRGIYISGVVGARITSNNFELPLKGAYETYGLYLNESRGYHVEDNEFFHNGDGLGYYGIYARNSGTVYNSIYNNIFDNLRFGIVPYGINRNGNYEGLCIKCNDFSNNENDILVTKDDNHIGPNYGIAYHQGYRIPNDTAPAGNTFSDPPIGLNIINSEDCNYFEYVYHDNHPIDVEVYPDPVQGNLDRFLNVGTNYNKDFSCPSKLESGGGSGSKENLEQSESEIEVKETELATLVDGGDTEEMTFMVQTSFPDEAQQLTEELLGESPYLSDTVMKSAIYKEEVLPNAMVRDVLVANPQSAKSQEILGALDERFVPVPDYMMAEIMQGRNIIGSKEALEAELAKWKQERSKAFNDLFLFYRNDTINNYAKDSLIALLTNEPVLSAKYSLASVYLSQKDTTLMNDVINDIPLSFTLDDDEQLEYENYHILFDILKQLQADTMSIFDMDSVAIESLLNIYENDHVLPGVYARNILIALGKIQYNEPFNIPDSLKSSFFKDYDLIKNKADDHNKSLLKAFLNPAGDFIIIEFAANGNSVDIIFKITDANGRLILKKHSDKMKDQVIIYTKNWKQGIYLVQMISDGKVENTTKFILLR
ncbi:MAG: T9SS type A sorting domain-containing protein [Bacteroidetes bacterium]|nr:T9SS type A sorting domain-containing protein [Bacteroidota bacterium]